MGKGPVLVGFVVAQAAADEAEILTLGVDRAFGRRGIASRLVEGVKRAALRAGAVRLFLEVAEGNGAARGLYLKHGFHEVGRRQGYYTGPDGGRADALQLAVDLASEAERGG
jgi:ribosomal-protein-alanine N-acetyltransferase